MAIDIRYMSDGSLNANIDGKYANPHDIANSA